MLNYITFYLLIILQPVNPILFQKKKKHWAITKRFFFIFRNPESILRIFFAYRMTLCNDRHTITIPYHIRAAHSFVVSAFERRHGEYRQFGRDSGRVHLESSRPLFLLFFLSIYPPPTSTGESVHQTEPTKRQIFRGKDDDMHICI